MAHEERGPGEGPRFFCFFNSQENVLYSATMSESVVPFAVACDSVQQNFLTQELDRMIVPFVGCRFDTQQLNATCLMYKRAVAAVLEKNARVAYRMTKEGTLFDVELTSPKNE